MRKEKINISAERKEQLLQRHLTDTGHHRYDIAPSQVTQKDIAYMANVINKRLYNLEKKGLTEQSNEYQIIEKYAMKGAVSFNVNMEKGTIRVKTSAKGMKGREREEFVNVLRNIMRSKTSTVKGTKEAMRKRYEGFLESEGKTKKEIPYKKYEQIWKAFNKANKDREEKYHYSLALHLIDNEFFRGLERDQMDTALDYMNNYESPLDGLDQFIMATRQSN